MSPLQTVTENRNRVFIIETENGEYGEFEKKKLSAY